MVGAPTKKADLVEISHPGYRVVYHLSEDKHGKPMAVPYTMADIDAYDAIRKAPKEYSFDPPDGVDVQPAVGVHNPFQAPTSIASQAVGGADTSVGHGNGATRPDAETQRLMAEVDDAKAASDKANADLEAAKGKNDAKVTAAAQKDADAANAKLADAQAKLADAKK